MAAPRPDGRHGVPVHLFGADGNKKVGSLMGEHLVVAAVPEPQTYAMMLGGLGLLGFMARRKRS